MVILSFTIKDMRDDVEHLESLGKAQTAVVRFYIRGTRMTPSKQQVSNRIKRL